MIRCILKKEGYDNILLVEIATEIETPLNNFEFGVYNGNWEGEFKNGKILATISHTDKEIVLEGFEILFWDADFLYYEEPYQNTSDIIISKVRDKLQNNDFSFGKREWETIIIKKPKKHEWLEL